MHANGRTSTLSWLLDDLVDRMAFIQQAAVLSVDGLLISASRGLTQEDAEHLCAVAAGFQGLARGAGRRFAAGPPRQIIVELAGAFLFVTAAGQGACLAVLTSAEVDMGLIAYEMGMLVIRVGEYLSAPTRPVTVPTDAQ